MTEEQALSITRAKLLDNNLKDWKASLIDSSKYLGMCSYKDKTIYLGKQSIKNHPDHVVNDTILHEIAHALTDNTHDLAWRIKAKELGAIPIACYFEEKEIKQPKEIKEHLICPTCSKESEVVKEIPALKRVILSCSHLVSRPKPIELISKDGKKPYPFQLEGMNFIKYGDFKVLIADEMGLGKTIQAVGAMKLYPNNLLPCLALVKSALKMQWMTEFLRWNGLDYIPQIIEDGKLGLMEGFNIYISSYDILRRFTTKETVKEKNSWGHEVDVEVKKNHFYDFPFKSIILDEVQSIKGNSKRTDEVKRICQGKNIIALSGTPIKNHAAEYYTILNILRPELFPTLKNYLTTWVDYEAPKGIIKYKGLRNPERFKEYTKSFIIRRSREEVMPELPKISRVFHHVDFESEKLKKMYEKAEADFIREMESDVKGKNPLAIIARISVMRHLVGLNKIQPTVEHAIDFLENTERKLTIFLHHQDVMEAVKLLLQKYCLENNLNEPLYYHSGLNMDERHTLLGKFKDEKKNRLFIASTLAAGEGLNMQFCSDCIIAERQWNPANEEQAESRFIRIGRDEFLKQGIITEAVTAEYMVASGTIDEYFTEIVEKKRAYMMQTLTGRDLEWDEQGLLNELYDVLTTKNRKKTFRGF